MANLDNKVFFRNNISKVMRMYPSLFKHDYIDGLEPMFELQDSSITSLYFTVSNFGVDMVYFKTYCSKYGISLSLIEEPMGVLTNYSKDTISDASCVGLFNLNISVKCKDFESGKTKYLDRKAITRRYTIKEIISHD